MERKPVGRWSLVSYFLRLGAQASIFDVPTALIGIVSLLTLWRFKIPELALIAVAALAGIALYRGG